MLIRVLGSAAGGGFPQWNCGCATAAGARERTLRARARRRSGWRSAPTATAWFLLNGSPEIRQQIEAFPGAAPARAAPLADRRHRAHQRRPRSLPGPVLAARVASAGRLRDRAPCARGFIEGNVLYRTLERFPGQVDLAAARARGARRRSSMPTARRSASRSTAVAVPGKLPLHLEGGATADPGGQRRAPDPRAGHRTDARVPVAASAA